MHRLGNAQLEAQLSETIDVTLPGPPARIGSIHPIRRVMRDVGRYFTRLGFAVLQGPEIETDANNFDALNIPPDHPAREGLDSFYLRPDLVLRTHTSPMQVRAMRESGPPIAIIVPGKAYRRDAVDARHLYQFHQVEGLMVGPDIHFGHLKGVLTGMMRELFGPRQDVRFRPSFFPFTEPSAEIDTTCPGCARQRDAEARRIVPHLRRLGLDRDRRFRHGASERAARGRLRSRTRRRLGLRLRPRTHRDGALRDERHPRLRRKHARFLRADGVALMSVPISLAARLRASCRTDRERRSSRGLATLGFPVDAVETRPDDHRRRRRAASRRSRSIRTPTGCVVCTVDIGADRALTIATAATNVAEGQVDSGRDDRREAAAN